MDLYVNKLAVVQFSENQSRIAVVFTPVSHLRGRGFRGAFALSSHFFGKKFGLGLKGTQYVDLNSIFLRTIVIIFNLTTNYPIYQLTEHQ